MVRIMLTVRIQTDHPRWMHAQRPREAVAQRAPFAAIRRAAQKRRTARLRTGGGVVAGTVIHDQDAIRRQVVLQADQDVAQRAPAL